MEPPPNFWPRSAVRATIPSPLSLSMSSPSSSSSTTLSAPSSVAGSRLTMTSPVSSRSPQCARCRNHGTINRIKGHKNYCENRFCPCARCEQTADRQRIMARQISRRRAAAATTGTTGPSFSNVRRSSFGVASDDSGEGLMTDDFDDDEESGPVNDADRRLLLRLALHKYSLDYEGLLFLVALQKIFMNVEETDRETNAAFVEFDVLVKEGKNCDVDLVSSCGDEEEGSEQQHQQLLKQQQDLLAQSLSMGESSNPEATAEASEAGSRPETPNSASLGQLPPVAALAAPGPNLAAFMARLVRAQFALMSAAAASASVASPP